MLKVLLVCSAGMSTSFLVEKMKKSAQEKGIEAEIKAIPEAQANEYIGKVDILLLGPQVKYLEAGMKEMFGETPVSVINMMDYGAMNGEKVLNNVLDILKK